VVALAQHSEEELGIRNLDFFHQVPSLSFLHEFNQSKQEFLAVGQHTLVLSCLNMSLYQVPVFAEETEAFKEPLVLVFRPLTSVVFLGFKRW